MFYTFIIKIRNVKTGETCTRTIDIPKTSTMSYFHAWKKAVDEGEQILVRLGISYYIDSIKNIV